MSAGKIKVPDGLLKAFLGERDYESYRESNGAHFAGDKEQLEAALRWLSENPIVPTDAQAG